MNCEFCNRVFTTKSSLRYHQSTAKYCLTIQGKNNNVHSCSFCKKQYTQKIDLERHLLKCSELKTQNIEINYQKIIMEKDNTIIELEKSIEDQRQQIKDLQATIEKLASQAISRTTNTTTKNTQINNYIQQLQPITDDILKDNVPNLTIEHILKGAEGYAEYALEYPLKNRIICVDYARRKVKFKDSNGNLITDPEMTNIATKFFQSIKDKNKFLIFEYGNAMKERFGDELETIVKIMDNKMNVDNGADGAKTEFYHEFVKNICSKSVID